ncbi:Uncharacterized protein AC501_2494 [Pseudomonas amygdali pv. lachrymans]|nr:Uncharacterized protein AC501_2494 [Pseudomonas amygdali pv. lachrymans]
MEQKVAAKKFNIQWDRALAVQERIERIDALLGAELPNDKVAAILSTMPEDFVELFPRMKLVA